MDAVSCVVWAPLSSSASSDPLGLAAVSHGENATVVVQPEGAFLQCFCCLLLVLCCVLCLSSAIRVLYSLPGFMTGLPLLCDLELVIS